MPGYNLIFDADDTLWENNVFFERAIEGFLDYVDHPTHTREELRVVLDDVERANSAVHGYGARAFERSLVDCLEQVRSHVPVGDADRVELRRLCTPLFEFEVELLDGVSETLTELANRHRLFLLTKGHAEDQQRKIDTSGLAPLFTATRVVPEKDPDAYRTFGVDHGLDPVDTWMIGNSPKSDIWPALEAGMGAVLVPHPMTWSLEHANVPQEHDRFRTLAPLGKLTRFF